MKELLHNIQQPFLYCSIALVFFSFLNSKDANEFIDKQNEENSSDYRKRKLPRASEGMLIITLILLVVVLITTYN